MTAQSKTVIKSYFETGDKPTQAQFADLVDSYQDVGGTTNYVVAASASVVNGLTVFANVSGNAVKGITNSGVVVVTSGAVTTPAGTTGQVLTSNGPGAAPTFQTASGGAVVLLQTQTASNSSSIDFTTGINSTYNSYFVVINNLTPGNNSTTLRARIDIGAGFDTSSNYSSDNIAGRSNTATDTTNGTTSFSLPSPGNLSTTASGFAAFTFVMSYRGSVSTPAVFGWEGRFYSESTGDSYTAKAGANFGLAGAVQGLRFFMSAGNIATGTFKLYGVT